MAIPVMTPRDRLQRLVDLARKAARYWWLVVGFAVVGGGLSLAFALLRTQTFQSWSTIIYQERIRSSVLMTNQEEIVQRNIAEQYGELLTARPQLEPILTDAKLDPYPDLDDVERKIDLLRQVIKLDVRAGGKAFRIVYSDRDPDRAKAVVEKLTKALQDKDDALRRATALKTVEFATAQKEQASVDLKAADQALAGFLAKHPEFAQDNVVGGAEGASIRAIRSKNPTTSNNPRLVALERQRQRIQARLDAPADTPVRVVAPPSQERIAAQQAVDEAQRELVAAQRTLDDALAKYTELHPDAKKARSRVDEAQQRLRQAQAAMPPDSETVIAPASSEDRAKLQRELQQLNNQIADLQRSDTKPSAGSAAPDNSTDWVVALETEHSRLRRAVTEQRDRVSALAAGVFRAQIDANQKLAETGSRLEIIDPAFRPVRPSGPGKSLLVLGGLVVFIGLGIAIAIGLAMIDDRLYRRSDLEQLGVAVLAVIPRAPAADRAPADKAAA